MNPRIVNRIIACLVIFIAGLASRSAALSIDPFLWQQLAEQADFIGQVECVTAGGNIARYRVTDVWKGNVRVGDVVSLRIPPDAWGTSYDVRLVGQKFLVTAIKDERADPVMSAAIAGVPPAWWRNLPSDYTLPFYEVGAELASAGHKGDDFFGGYGDRRRLSEVRDDFLGYLALPEQARTLALLRALATKYLERREEEKSPADLATAVKRADSLDKAIMMLIQAWDSGEKAYPRRLRIERIIEQAGTFARRRTLELARSPQDSTYTLKAGESLAQFTTARFGRTVSAHEIFAGNQNVIDDIDVPRPGVTLQLYARRSLINACLGFDAPTRLPSPPPPAKAPTAEDIARARGQFATLAADTREYENAAELLIVHDPELVLNWLKTWKAPTDGGWRDIDRGYVLGSWAAARCGGDRSHFLGELLQAADPHIRVAAAVYLAFEDEAKGREELRKLTTLPGDPGAWAALTLVRYGEREGIVRAIGALSADASGLTARGLLRPLLASRLLEVVSNTAAAHQLPTPARLNDQDAAARVVEFFVQNRTITPTDPWLAELRRQKAD